MFLLLSEKWEEFIWLFLVAAAIGHILCRDLRLIGILWIFYAYHTDMRGGQHLKQGARALV